MADGIPVIDLFAGPGGLGEGFSSFVTDGGAPVFDIRLSIEKDAHAHATLELRSFFRQFHRDDVPDEYYDFLRRSDVSLPSRRDDLFGRFPEQVEAAVSEAWRAELGGIEAGVVRERISAALKNTEHWVLLGGPPCQAYSLVGRSRNRGIDGYTADKDHRQFLYVEYLQVLADYSPAVFVMENVKGLLSATVRNERIFNQILDDLSNPASAIERENRTLLRQRGRPRRPQYQLFSIVDRGLFEGSYLRDFVVRMEKYGIPQARHRIIVLGVREDLAGTGLAMLEQKDEVSLRQVLQGLPRLRSGLSRRNDAPDAWVEAIRQVGSKRWFRASKHKAGSDTFRLLEAGIQRLRRPRFDRGGEFIRGKVSIGYCPEWYLDPRIEGACNHSARAHIVKDLWRYYFAACFAQAHGRSPQLKDFPANLLPAHQNVAEAMNGSRFSDRFRVQLFDRPSTTITSHISKDGHYYIHPDPTQCRSLTVREAARLQTFPDNYFFCGPRTSQYVQVGNAVPPLLAVQIAEITCELLSRTGVTA